MKHYYFLVIVFVNCAFSWSQSSKVTDDDAFNKYVEISDTMAISFPEDEMKTFRRISFSEAQLQTYLSQHITRMALLPKIKGRYTFVMNSYLHSGNWYNSIGFPQKSIEAYNQFFDYYREHENKFTDAEKQVYVEMQTFAYGLLASNYANQGEYSKAASAYIQNIDYTEFTYDIFYPSALNNYGLYFYKHTKQIDSAFHYFQKAYQATEINCPNHTLIGSIRDNIADIYIDNNNFKAAEPLYSENFDFFKTAINEMTLEKDVPRLILAGAQLTTTLVALNKIKKADQVFENLSEIINENRKILEVLPSLQMEYLSAKAILLKKQKNYKEAFSTINAVRTLSDSLHTIDEKNDINWRNELNKIILNTIAFNFELEQAQKENQMTAERQKYWITGSILMAALTILISLFYRRQQHLVLIKNKQQLAEQQLENTNLKVDQLNSEIKFKERDLSDFAISLTQNRSWAKELEGKLNDISSATPKKTKKLLTALQQDVQQKITLDNSSHDFLERLDQLSTAFYTKLNNRFPNLTKTEIRLCSLIRLKIDSASIAAIQNITLASLHTSRYRLRKKLNLKVDTDLDVLIQNL